VATHQAFRFGLPKRSQPILLLQKASSMAFTFSISNVLQIVLNMILGSSYVSLIIISVRKTKLRDVSNPHMIKNTFQQAFLSVCENTPPRTFDSAWSARTAFD
jgi:hypothetical protein